MCKGGKEVPISIKQDNAEMWESSDSYFGDYVRDIFERLDLLAQVDYKKTVWNGKGEGYNWALEKGSEFKVKVNDRQIVKDVCFGNDIHYLLNNPFRTDDAIMPGNGNQVVYCNTLVLVIYAHGLPLL